MLYESGQSGNPAGRPKGSYGGRIMALASLDKLLAKKKNQNALMDALEKDLLKDPVGFFKTVIMPLLPRESKLSFDNDGVIQWKSLIGVSAETVGSMQLAGGSDGNPHPSPRPSQGEGVVVDIQEVGSKGGQ
jgi:hypothetical protein